jgi:hypothetical protein
MGYGRRQSCDETSCDKPCDETSCDKPCDEKPCDEKPCDEKPFWLIDYNINKERKIYAIVN